MVLLTIECRYGRILQRINKSNEFTRRISVRILKWMACSYRKLKPFELQDGLAFYPGNTVLDGTTKLSIHVLDQCKPLIEQGSSGALDFVHFSAKEYVFPVLWRQLFTILTCGWKIYSAPRQWTLLTGISRSL
jgi:hypothetical protein